MIDLIGQYTLHAVAFPLTDEQARSTPTVSARLGTHRLADAVGKNVTPNMPIGT